MRCDEHGLACGPDGQCVLCHRERRVAKAPTGAPPASRSHAGALVAGGALLVLGAVLGVRSLSPPRPPPARPDVQLGIQGPTPTASPSWREANRDVHVVVYTTGWCPHCREAKAWMNANGVAYEEHDIEASSDDARRNRSINPRGSIPTFDVDGDVMVGFSAGNLVAMIERAAQRRARQN